ncbi:hypothetical protein PIB30_089537 [Stylosanthes scabra]|uniref:Uncharacterized protein n=1 Tax=Stylosanthes scabra TaxID=79078 RepID=A0ABU6ZSP1_9FABA|nr:hypothetical protein [Stylosanthes scabra]
MGFQKKVYLKAFGKYINREEVEEEEENRGTKEAWNYNNLMIGALNTKPKDEKNNLECQKTTPRHGKTQRKPSLGVVHFWVCCQLDLCALNEAEKLRGCTTFWATPKRGSNVTEPHGQFCDVFLASFMVVKPQRSNGLTLDPHKVKASSPSPNVTPSTKAQAHKLLPKPRFLHVFLKPNVTSMTTQSQAST